MSFVLRSVELENFRKFRAPKSITGLTEGMNIVVEANEIGKSTLLEALHAAFFVRHGTQNQLARSYQPTGDNVAPCVTVDSEVGGEAWHVAKRFLKSPSVELTGPGGRTQSDDAEDRLQELLGFEKDSSRKGDDETRGALGLLWVGQASALEVSAPGRLVQSTVRSALEAEVGTIVGGPLFEAVSARVEASYGMFHTDTGRAKGPLVEATRRVEAAREAVAAARAKATAYERLLDELDGEKARKVAVDREVADPEDIATRERLAGELEVAKGADQQLATAKAEHDAAAGTLDRLTELDDRFTAAEAAIEEHTSAMVTADEALDTLADELERATAEDESARTAHEEAKAERDAASDELKRARTRELTIQRRERRRLALERLVRLRELEAERSDLEGAADTAATPEHIAELEALERRVTEARAVVAAGATRVRVERHDGSVLTIDGEDAIEDELEVTPATSIGIGAHATVHVTPPAGGGAVSARGAVEVAEAYPTTRTSWSRLPTWTS